MLQIDKLTEIQIQLLSLLPDDAKQEAVSLLHQYKDEVIELTFKLVDKQIATAKHFKNHI